MSFKQQLETALQNAHAAGDEQAARKLAGSLQQVIADEELYNPAKDMGFGESLLVGAGRTFDKIGAGVQSLFGGEETEQRIAQEQALRDETFAPLQEESPWATGIGQALPYIATAPLSGGLGTQVALGAGLSGLEHSQDLGAGQAQNAAIGGALSAVPFGLGKAGRSIFGNAARGAEEAAEQGFRLSPAQRSGSEIGGRIEAGLESTPFVGGPLNSLKQGNQQNMNRIAAESIGETLPKGGQLTEDVLGDAASNIGKQFDNLTAGRTIPLDKTFNAGLRTINEGAGSGLFNAGNKARGALAKMENIAKGGKITDTQYQQFSSELSKTLRSKALEWTDKEPLIALKTLLDDAVETTLGPAELAAFRSAREQYKNLIALQAPGVWKAGNVSGASLGNYLKRTDVTGYMRGGNTSPLYEGARTSQRFASAIGDSGTATRSFPQQFMRNPGLVGLLGGAGALGTKAYASLPANAKLAGASGLLANPAVGLGAAGLFATE